MPLSEIDIQSFIVKLWLEGSRREDEPVTWRGQVTQVPSGTHCSAQSIEEIAFFILSYLERVGVRIDWRWRFKRWMWRRMGRVCRSRRR